MANSSTGELTQTAVYDSMERNKMLINAMSKVNMGKQISMLPDLKQNISIFDGESGDCMIAEKWLNIINVMSDLHNWPSKYKLKVACTNLSGLAENWYFDNQTNLKKWKNFEKLFKETFMTQAALAKRWKKMAARVQIKGETVFSYIHDKMQLSCGLGLSEFEKKKLLCMGLSSKELSNVLLNNSHTSDASLLADIVEFEGVTNTSISRFQLYTRYPEQGDYEELYVGWPNVNL